jgi:hypothetical protein
VYPVHLDWRSFDHICEGLVPTSPFFSLVCVSFRPLSFSFNYCRFVICFEVRKWVHFSMFTFSGLFWLCSVLWDSIWVLDAFFPISSKNTMGMLIGIACS